MSTTKRTEENKMATTTWVDQQVGTVNQFEKVEHTFVNEDTGEMYCSVCGESEHCVPNRRRALIILWQQIKAFESFTEKHLHGKVV
jgi:uncharacterized protein (UPF0212 family)